MLSNKALSAAAVPSSVAIEDVFSTWLYTGTDSAVTITNGIDLAGEGGLVWVKSRGPDETLSHCLQDTLRGTGVRLISNTTDGNTSTTSHITAFNNNGFAVGTSLSNGFSGGQKYASWTFRKAPRFFDVVTYTGTGSNRTIAHNLGVVPGCIIVKRTDTTADWQVYHRSNANTEYMVLNTTAAKATGTTRWNSTTPTSAVFSLGTDTSVNASGGTYVAYIFAHDPLGPSGDGSDGLIACGSFTTDSSSNAVVNLGWEPQFLIVKPASTTGNWNLQDNMRGLATNYDNGLYPNLSLAESPSAFGFLVPTATGFNVNSYVANATLTYIAIRRGPMREPTSGTQVLGLNARTGTGANATVTGGLTADAVLVKNRGSSVHDLFSSRLTGTAYLVTSSAIVEAAAGTTTLQANPWDVMDGVKVGTTSTLTNASSNTFINYLFKRAPGFFDVVVYTGTGVSRTVSHNLGAAPELMIVKNRFDTAGWPVYHISNGNTGLQYLQTTAGKVTSGSVWASTTPTDTTFAVNTDVTNISGRMFIAYLFATLPGISKVGSYTGNGSSQTINCAFTTGARFILIKRTDSTGAWYVWDTARGIITGNDPYFSLNTDGREVATDDTIDPDSSGFIVNQVAATNVNVNTATYIYLAIA
jgi:hypothetical protein